METWVNLIPTLGFPIVACLGMAVFIFVIYKNTVKQHADDMAQVQERCKEREEKLYEYLEKGQEVNAKALGTLELYAERLTVVEKDVRDIKDDVSELLHRTN